MLKRKIKIVIFILKLIFIHTTVCASMCQSVPAIFGGMALFWEQSSKYTQIQNWVGISDKRNGIDWVRHGMGWRWVPMWPAEETGRISRSKQLKKHGLFWDLPIEIIEENQLSKQHVYFTCPFLLCGELFHCLRKGSFPNLFIFKTHILYVSLGN